jgi:hypothetical protein
MLSYGSLMPCFIFFYNQWVHFVYDVDLVSDAPINTTKIMKRSEIHCQFCVGSKLEVNKIAIELKSALKIIEIMKEELDFASLLPNANKNSKRNSGTESQISLSERNWIQIQKNQHKKVTDKVRSREETYIGTINRFEILSNLNEAIGTTEPMKEKIPKLNETVLNNMDKINPKQVLVNISMM